MEEMTQGSPIYNKFNDMMHTSTKMRLEIAFRDYCKQKGIKEYKLGAPDNSYTYRIERFHDNSDRIICTIFNGKKNPNFADVTLEVRLNDVQGGGRKMSFETDQGMISIIDWHDDGRILFKEDKVWAMIEDHKEFFDALGHLSKR